MCGRKKRDPRIDEEQKKAREDAEAVKAAALADQEKKRQELLAKEKEADARAEADKAARQAELDMQAGELNNTGTSKQTGRTSGLFASKAARRRSRSARSGRRGRRSLLTSSGGGVVYFSRFL